MYSREQVPDDDVQHQHAAELVQRAIRYAGVENPMQVVGGIVSEPAPVRTHLEAVEIASEMVPDINRRAVARAIIIRANQLAHRGPISISARYPFVRLSEDTPPPEKHRHDELS